MGIFEHIKNIIQGGINMLIAVFKVISISKFFVEFPKLKDDRIAFLANGPSLDVALEKMKAQGMPDNIMVTNFFCNSNYFNELQPNYYTVCDPLFNYEGYKKDERIRDFYATIYKVSWELNFFIPFAFRKSVEKIKMEGNYQNENVKIYFYNNVNFNGDSAFLLSLMHLKLGIPRVATVAVPAIFNCMHLGGREIQVGGVDLNQHQDITVGKDNVVKLKSKHFYNKEEQVTFKPWLKANGKSYTTSQIFQVFYRFFYSFDITANYAAKYKIEIKNYSEDSFLDQFIKE